ncbi:SRPBCC domain-containing protein [Nocardia sp. NPDC046473]|uniref:SRPBCC family protein n=1 Tax=Nocardia sp. NPDC046473 TaxID=3155733 RepID=UPI0033D829DF
MRERFEVLLHGPIEAVFDLITQARFWPQWHPYTRSVGGVTERPFRLGDAVYEHGVTDGVDFHLYWEVREYERPRRVMLYDRGHDATLRYTFEERGGETLFSREQWINPDRAHGVANTPVSFTDRVAEASEAAVIWLADHINGLLDAEKVSIPPKEVAEGVVTGE